MTTCAAPAGLPELVSGSVAAKALYEIWSGTPAVVISAPPGAGKTTLVVQVLSQLVSRTDMRIAVAAQTRAQAFDIANRINAALPREVAVLASGRDKARDPATGKEILRVPRGINEGVQFRPNARKALESRCRVVVAPTAKWRFHQNGSTSQTDFDLLIIDEAWQCTQADMREIAHVANQFLLVGDPGQIAPVISADISRFSSASIPPNCNAPAFMIAAYPDHVTQLQMPETYRCGPETARLLQPLYPFPFTSARGTEYASIAGLRQPELLVSYVEAASVADTRLFGAVAQRVVDLSAGHFTSGESTRAIAAEDIAVGVAHVHQVAGVRARLPEHLAGVTVDTAERLQGLEFACAVMLDPMAGLRETAEHNADNGRLCVMLSRARAHTSFISTEAVIPILSLNIDDPAAALGVRVRHGLADC